MDRVTATRNFRHLPNRLAHMALDGTRVRVNTLDAVGDYIHSEDVAGAIISLLRAPRLRYSTYNLAAGEVATVGDLVRWIAEKVPGFRAEVTAPEEADILQDATLTGGMWGAYDVSRIACETGWKPRPVREALHAYLDVDRRRAPRGSMNSPDPYPRDLIGYGARPPHPRWPQDARIAVSIVLNYEEGGEITCYTAMRAPNRY